VSQTHVEEYGYAMLKISMVSDRYYEQSFRTLGAPAETHDLVETAKFLFDGASVGYKADHSFPIPESFQDTPSGSHAHWESLDQTPDNFERLGLTLVSNALIIALEHRHPDAVSPHILRRLSIVIRAQDVTLFSAIGGRPERQEGSHSHDILGEFVPRLDHAMGRIGLIDPVDRLVDVH